jgi:hypothetical protein
MQIFGDTVSRYRNFLDSGCRAGQFSQSVGGKIATKNNGGSGGSAFRRRGRLGFEEKGCRQLFIRIEPSCHALRAELCYSILAANRHENRQAQPMRIDSDPGYS